MILRPALLLLLAPLLACSTTDAPTWHADVKPLFDAKCNACHVEGGLAPFPLDTFADASRMQVSVLKALEERRMPPWLAAPGCNTYRDDPSLTDAELARVREWVDAGTPEGSPVASGQPLTPVAPGLSRVDLKLEMPSPYSPDPKKSDDYRCFILDWPHDTTQYVTGFRASPGDPRVVHHVIAFLIRPEGVAEYEKLDADEAGEGYTCFGGPGGRTQGQVGWLGAWAPGTLGDDYPAGTGLKVEPGSKVVMQVHYNTAAALGESLSDLTAVELKVDPTVEKKALLMPFTNFAWVQAAAMPIPVGESDVTHDFSGDPSGFMERLSRGALASGEPFLIHQATLHMHTLGTAASLVVRRQAGGVECLLDIARWDFNWQRSYPLATPVRFEPGDALSIECHWDNSKSRVVNGVRTEPQDANWGEGTGDEMCLGLLYVSQP